MPRSRRKPRRGRRATHIEPLPDPFQAIIDSDNSSVPSSIADDYITNLRNQSDTEVLSPSTSPRTRSPTPGASSSSDSQSPPRSRKPHPREIIMEDCMTAFTKFSKRSNAQLAHSCQPSPDSRHRLALHRSAELLGASSASMGDGKVRYVIIKWPTGKPVPISEAAFERGVTRILDELIPEERVRMSPSPGASSSSDSQSPPRSRKPHRRDIIMVDCMTAFTKFSQRSNGQLTHSCQPSPDSRHRLALHRSAELLGASSSSMGDGKGRYVIIKWPTGKRVPISEAAFERGVTRILDELIPEKRVRRTGGREKQREFARQLRLARLWNDDDADVDTGKTEMDMTVGTAEKVGRGNIGFDMLQKMGWSEGTGLGAERDGRVDPVIGQRRMRRAGLGSI